MLSKQNSPKKKTRKEWIVTPVGGIWQYRQEKKKKEKKKKREKKKKKEKKKRKEN